MHYYNQQTFNNITYSIDRCRINFTVNPKYINEINSILMSLRTDITIFPITHTQCRYRNLIQFQYPNDSTMVMGFSFNGFKPSEDKYKGYLDFNPNKVSHNKQFWDDYKSIKSACYNSDFEIVRIDLACDIPINREYVILQKDNRKYALDMRSNINKTEYLGQRSNIGFVKIYNKQLESKLNKPLTRVELTIEPTLSSFQEHLPKIYDISNNSQLDYQIEKLTDTQKYIIYSEWQLIINGLDPGLTNFNSLGRKTKEKIRQFILPDSSLVNFSSSTIFNVINTFLSIY